MDANSNFDWDTSLNGLNLDMDAIRRQWKEDEDIENAKWHRIKTARAKERGFASVEEMDKARMDLRIKEWAAFEERLAEQGKTYQQWCEEKYPPAEDNDSDPYRRPFDRCGCNGK